MYYEGRSYYCERLNGHFYVDMSITRRQLGAHNFFCFCANNFAKRISTSTVLFVNVYALRL
jgi:hypothetical protein